MKLTASMMVTLDSVYQGPGGPDEGSSGRMCRTYPERRHGGFRPGGGLPPSA